MRELNQQDDARVLTAVRSIEELARQVLPEQLRGRAWNRRVVIRPETDRLGPTEPGGPMVLSDEQYRELERDWGSSRFGPDLTKPGFALAARDALRTVMSQRLQLDDPAGDPAGRALSAGLSANVAERHVGEMISRLRGTDEPGTPLNDFRQLPILQGASSELTRYLGNAARVSSAEMENDLLATPSPARWAKAAQILVAGELAKYHVDPSGLSAEAVRDTEQQVLGHLAGHFGQSYEEQRNSAARAPLADGRDPYATGLTRGHTAVITAKDLVQKSLVFNNPSDPGVAAALGGLPPAGTASAAERPVAGQATGRGSDRGTRGTSIG